MAKKNSKLCLGCMSLLETATEQCPHCGYSKTTEYDVDYLRPGRTLSGGRYLAGRLARKNGESAYYVGYDVQEKHTCWIREYFPTTLSRRVRSKGIITPLEGVEAQYKALLSDFMDVCNEVKRLGITENVVPITATFVENNTVYAIYEHMSLISFDEYLSKKGGKLPLNHALDMLTPFFNMVATIHDHGFIHRGISPYTVFVDENDTVFLWDFSIGAARTANSELEAELFNGYSAPEQYSSSGWQGTWTDIYAIAALFYRTISGFVPPKSTFVGEDRHMAPLSDLVIDMPQGISDAVEEAMLPAAEKRTQAVYKFTSALFAGDGTGTAVYGAPKPAPKPDAPVRVKEDGGFKYAIFALMFTVLVLVVGLWYIMKTYFPSMMDEPDKTTPVHSLQEEISNFESEIESEPASQSGEIDTPRFVGQMLSAIQSDEDYQELFVFEIEEEFNEEFPDGVVFKQAPPADTSIALGGNVTLYVSKGTDEIAKMPNIIGLDYSEAFEVLTKLNIKSERIERYATGVVAGSVVGTSPAPGESVGSEDVVTVYVMPGSAQQAAPAASTSSKSSSSSKKSSSSSDSKSSSSSKKSSSSSESKSSSSSKNSG